MACRTHRSASEPPKPPRLRHNIAALGLVQISTYLVPFITLPYLTRVLEPEAYGKVAFAQVMMAYFIMFVDYGFSWSATRKIAARRSDREYISHVFMDTWCAQWFLTAISGFCVAAAVLFIRRLGADAILYAAAFTAVLGDVLFPVWFLQGLEQLKVVAALQFVVRILTLAPIFLFVTRPSDMVLVLLINGGSLMFGGVLALVWMRRQNLVDWTRPSVKGALVELRDGLSLFGSRISISFYTTFVPLALGWLAGPVALANFQVANKLRSAVQGLLSPLSQALFPRMSLLFTTDEKGAMSLMRRSVLLVVVLAGLGGLLVFVLANWIVLVLAGDKFPDAASVLRWLAFVPLIVALSNMFGVQVMLPKGMNRPFNIILMGAGLVGVLVIIPFVRSSEAVGAAEAVLVVELVVTVAMAGVLQHRGYLFFSKRGVNGGL